MAPQPPPKPRRGEDPLLVGLAILLGVILLIPLVANWIAQLSYFDETCCETSASNTPASPSTNSTTNLSEKNLIQTALAALTPGSVVHNIPIQMYVGQAELIEVRISDDPQAILTDNLAGQGQPQSTTIPVSTYMTAILTGTEEAFKIEQQTPDTEQIVVGITEWSWTVTPLKSGTHLLQLQVFAKITLGNIQHEKNINVLKREVHVKTDISHTIQIFMVNYWQWIASTLAIPLVGWLWNKYRSRANSQPQGNQPTNKRQQKSPKRRR